MRTIVQIMIFLPVVFLSYTVAFACTCAGVNPEVYPPDIPAMRTFYRNEFKGAAFTGRVISRKEAVGFLREGYLGSEKMEEIVIEVDRYWFGVDQKTMKIHTPYTPPGQLGGCWSPFRLNESYFFLPATEKDLLYVGSCAYATYNRKPDGNYVEFMVAMFGEGKRFIEKP